MTYRVYMDTLKPGERSNGGPWCYTLSSNGHVIRTVTGFYSKADAIKDASQYV